MIKAVQSLYAHVPFCGKKCAYCAFYSEASDAETVNRYVDCLIQEIRGLPPEFHPKTIFFGGGTPSLLTPPQWRKVLEAMTGRGLLAAVEEFTVECNPATVSTEKARLLREFGVNRMSMGVQSLDDALLDRLGRIHSRDAVFRSYESLRKAGFQNINIDLMFAIPGQTMETWTDTLGEALKLGSEHISAYEVIYEEDTPLFAELQAGAIREDEDLACAMYDKLVEMSHAAGFVRYEVANFARDTGRQTSEGDPENACRHNLNYWKGGQFHGIGPSATSYVGGVRRKNVANTKRYCEAIEAGRLPLDYSEELPPERRAGETAAFGLRMARGWSFDAFTRVTGYDLRKHWSDEMRQLEQEGFGKIEGDGFRLTSRGLRFADHAAELFLR